MYDPKRKQIWLNSALQELADKCGKAKGRDGKFSRRLGDIVERYEALISLTPVPVLTTEEQEIMSSIVREKDITVLLIKYLHESVLTSNASSLENREQLAEKIKKMSIADRIIVIEDILKEEK